MDLLTLYTLIPGVLTVVAFLVWAWERWQSKEARKGVSAWLLISIALLATTFVAYKEQPQPLTVNEESEKTRTAIGEQSDQTRADVNKAAAETKRLLEAVRAAIDQANRVATQPNPSAAALDAQIAALDLAKVSAEQIPDLAIRRSLVAEIAKLQVAATERLRLSSLYAAAPLSPSILAQPANPQLALTDDSANASPSKKSDPNVLLVPASVGGYVATGAKKSSSQPINDLDIMLTGFNSSRSGNPATGPVLYRITLAGRNFDPATIEVALDGPGCLPAFVSNANLIDKTPIQITIANVTLPRTGCTVIVKNAGSQSISYPFPISPEFR